MFADSGSSNIGMEIQSSTKRLSTRPTMTEKLKAQRDDLRTRLADLENAIEAIESSPQVQRAIDALAKLNI
jgi:chaperonin cofactor prefoldin